MRRESCCRMRRIRSGACAGVGPRPRGAVFRILASRCACSATRPTAPPTTRARDAGRMSLDDLPDRRGDRQRAHAGVGAGVARPRRGVSVVCLADLPPSPPSKTRYLVKRLHAALPDVRILVGRWGPPALADENTQALREAGAAPWPRRLRRPAPTLGGLAEIAAGPRTARTSVAV